MSYLDKYKSEIFKKYSDEELIKDINSYIRGGGQANKSFKSIL